MCQCLPDAKADSGPVTFNEKAPDKDLLKEQFTQMSKRSHYLPTSMLLGLRVKFVSETFLKLHGETET